MPPLVDLPRLLARVEVHLAAAAAAAAATAATAAPAGPEPTPELLSVVHALVGLVEERQALHRSDVRVFRAPAKAGTGVQACLENMVLGAKVGEGAFGEVFRVPLPSRKGSKDCKGRQGCKGCARCDRAGQVPARRPGPERAVKVQTLWPRPFWDTAATLATVLQRFKRESRLAAAAGGVGIGPRVHDAYVCQPAGPGGRTLGVTVMDLVEGVKLVEWRASASPGDVARAEALVREKVDRLHAMGIVHNDLHAGNVMVEPRRDGQGVSDVWVLDYGQAASAEELHAEDLRRDLATLGDGRRPVGDQHPAAVRERQVQAVARALLAEGSAR